jgi:hypothetical protein
MIIDIEIIIGIIINIESIESNLIVYYFLKDDLDDLNSNFSI